MSQNNHPIDKLLKEAMQYQEVPVEEVVRELLLTRFTTYLAKSESTSKTITGLNLMLHRNLSEFEATLKSTQDITNSMKNVLGIVLNPRKANYRR